MEFFRIKKDIPFMRHALVFNIISFVTFLLAVFFIVTKGLHLSIEFTGGTLMELSYATAPDVEKVREKLVQDGMFDPQVQNFGSSRDLLVRLPLKVAEGTAAGKNSEKIFGSLCAMEQGHTLEVNYTTDKGENIKKTICQNDQKAEPVSLKRVEFVGPQVGKELASDGAMALLLVVIGIVIYLAIRFEWRFAVSAIIANLHDVIIILGFFALFQWEFSLPVLAAVLAVLGYSVNESVVVFDRVRETFRKKRGLTTSEVIDHAITSTISRTIITHGSTQMMVTSMLIFGGTALHYFALALTIGILFGIYSSVLVASPLLMWLGASREQFVRQKVVKEEAVV
ncbi:MAG: protein translocase subunit SecF [Sterolibacterium sp.]|jgi:preprotein translocase subunit SecF|nr:protein translocase subunit SecF [Sterolibacterium sp.]